MKMQTTTTLAAEFDTTPRTLRKFLRSDASGIASVGKGSRYALPTAKREVNSLKKRFNGWVEAQAPKVEAPADDEPQLTEQGKQDKEFEENTNS